MKEIIFDYVLPIFMCIGMLLAIVFMLMAVYEYYRDIRRW